MKKFLISILLLTSFLYSARGESYFLQANMPLGVNWTQNGSWFDQTSGGGNNPEFLSGNNFHTNGFTLRTGIGPATTFSGASLTLDGILFQPQSPQVNILNTLIVTGGGSFRVHNDQGVVVCTIGTLDVGSDYRLRSPLATHALTSNIGVLTGSANLTFNNILELGTHTVNVGDASGYTGDIRVNDTILTFVGSGNAFPKSTLVLLEPDYITIELSGDVLFGALTGNGIAALEPGDYNATELNALVGFPVFSGEGNLTVGDASPPAGGGYATWAAANLPEGLRGPADQAFGDGIPNLIRYALLPPTADAADRPILPFIDGDADAYVFTIRSGVDPVVQHSVDLVQWEEVASQAEAAGEGFLNLAVPVSVGDRDRGFFRLLLRDE
jgi:hypothetical protein